MVSDIDGYVLCFSLSVEDKRLDKKSRFVLVGEKRNPDNLDQDMSFCDTSCNNC